MIELSGQKVLVLAAGGGYDIVVAEMLRRSLNQKNHNKSIDVAGFLNPKYEHFFSTDGFRDSILRERPINQLIECRRFRRSSALPSDLLRGVNASEEYRRCVHNRREKVHVDSLLRAKTTVPLYNFSTRFGVEALIPFLSKYTEILLVDVGGDILYHGRRDNEVRTPLIDAFALCCMNRLRMHIGDGVPVRVLVFGVGTDGELTADHLRQSIRELQKRDGTFFLLLTEIEMRILDDLYSLVKSGEGSGTIELICAIWHSNRTDSGLPSVRGRYMTPFAEWFNRVLVMSAETAISHNPLSNFDNFEQIRSAAASLGWIEPQDQC